MNIWIAGKDQTAVWQPLIEREAARIGAKGKPMEFPPEISALRLREARNERDYLALFVELSRRRQHIDTLGFQPPRRPGVLGQLAAAVRAVLWRLLRYQHDRMAFRQNIVNSQLLALAEWQAAELEALRRRLDECERRLMESK